MNNKLIETLFRTYSKADFEEMMKQLVLNTDSYKPSHFLQYPENTEYVSSYIESRGGVYDNTVFFGLQAYLKEYLCRPITGEAVEFAQWFWTKHGEPFNYEGWRYIVDKYDGKLPLKVRAVKEGSVVPTKNVLVQTINTDPECGWLTSYTETSKLRGVWYPTTVASQSYSIKQEILRWLEDGGTPEEVLFKLHDFGARGVSSFESAGLGGLGHIINFMGTDTATAILFGMLYYNVKDVNAWSVPAAEHSTTSILGRDGEYQQFERMLDQFLAEGKIVAVVSDTYSIREACRTWGTRFRDRIMKSGGRVVVRPDSGDPAQMAVLCLQELEKGFGTTVNSKGLKVLPPCIRIIYGDGINEQSIHSILFSMKIAGFSPDNIGFGMGGALLQQVNRDTNKFAMKASAARIDGEWVDVYKDPEDDAGKTSKKGQLELYQNGNDFVTLRQGEEPPAGFTPALIDVFENGELLVDYDFETIRAETAKYGKYGTGFVANDLKIAA